MAMSSCPAPCMSHVPLLMANSCGWTSPFRICSWAYLGAMAGHGKSATGFCRSSCDCLIGFGVCKCIRVQLVVPIWFTMINYFFPRLQGFPTWLPKQVSLNGTFSRHYSWEKCIWPEVKPSLNTVADLQHVSWCRNHSSWKGKFNYQV